MSTFYLMPPRPLLRERSAAFLKQMFPGLDWSVTDTHHLSDWLTAALADYPDVYVIHREDLAEGEDTPTALKHGYGAETGDEVVEVRLNRPDELTARRWRLDLAG